MLIDMSASTMEMAPKKSDTLSIMNSALSVLYLLCSVGPVCM